MTDKKNIQLLYLDDSPTHHHIVKQALTGSDIVYTGCYTSKEAKECLSENYYDVIVQDIIRPGDEMNGFMFSRWIRKFAPNEKQRQAPILIVSDLSEEELKRGSDTFKYNGYLNPTLIDKKLVSTICSLVLQKSNAS